MLKILSRSPAPLEISLHYLNGNYALLYRYVFIAVEKNGNDWKSVNGLADVKYGIPCTFGLCVCEEKINSKKIAAATAAQQTKQKSSQLYERDNDNARQSEKKISAESRHWFNVFNGNSCNTITWKSSPMDEVLMHTNAHGIRRRRRKTHRESVQIKRKSNGSVRYIWCDQWPLHASHRNR